MARRNDSASPEKIRPPQLNVSREKANADISEQIKVGELLVNMEVRSPADLKRLNSDNAAWNDFVYDLLRRHFDTPEYADYFRENFGAGISFAGETTFTGIVEETKSDIENGLQKLRSLKGRLSLFEEAHADPTNNPVQRKINNSKVFVVHGHDGQAKSEVARVLEKLGLEPVILHEQANQGQTVIEKFEASSDVGFAVVLLTPDDPGISSQPDSPKRARQNVVLELGYFLGKLGRSKVCPLYKEGVEIPSDLGGLVYVPMDGYGAWKMQLVKELRAVGYKVSSDDL